MTTQNEYPRLHTCQSGKAARSAKKNWECCPHSTGGAMSDVESFARLMARLRSGEDAAAREVFERFAGRLVALSRGRLSRLLARKVDPEDVVQSAFKSFFVRHRAGKLDVGDGDGLWNLLTLITLRKVADRAEYFQAERRDAAREATGRAGGGGADAGVGAPR